jgi:hypothetical protein
LSAPVFEIPLQAGTPQTLNISLAGVTYGLTVVWNNNAQVWVIDIDDSNGNPLIQGIPLVTGADLLEQYEYVGIGGSLYAVTDFDIAAPPTFDNLGQQGHLYFVPASS